MNRTGDALRAEYRADAAIDELARHLHDELGRSIKLLTEAREMIGYMGYTLRSLKATGDCVEDLVTLENAIGLFDRATDVAWDHELPQVQRLVAEYKETSGYDLHQCVPCEEEA